MKDQIDSRQARTRRRMVSAHRDASARSADDPVGHQQAAICIADGNQESEDERSETPHAGRSAGRSATSQIEYRARLPAGEIQADADRSKGLRKKSPPNLSRSSSSRRVFYDSRFPGAFRLPISPAVARDACRRATTGRGDESACRVSRDRRRRRARRPAGPVYSIRASAACSSTRRTATRSRSSNSSEPSSRRTFFCRIPTLFATSRRSWPRDSTACSSATWSRCAPEGGDLLLVRQLFQGKLNADVRVSGAAPFFVSIQAGVYRAEQLQSGSPAVEEFAVQHRRLADSLQTRRAVPRIGASCRSDHRRQDRLGRPRDQGKGQHRDYRGVGASARRRARGITPDLR